MPSRHAACLAALALLAGAATATPLRAAAAPAAPAFDPTTPDGLALVIRTIDERQRNQGDWKALCYLEVKEKGKTD